MKSRGSGSRKLLGGLVVALLAIGDLEEHRQGDSSREQDFGFGESAISSMNGWRYFPALQDGRPIEVEFQAIVQFRP